MSSVLSANHSSDSSSLGHIDTLKTPFLTTAVAVAHSDTSSASSESNPEIEIVKNGNVISSVEDPPRESHLIGPTSSPTQFHDQSSASYRPSDIAPSLQRPTSPSYRGLVPSAASSRSQIAANNSMASMRTMARPELQYNLNSSTHMRPGDSPTRSSEMRRSPNLNGSPSRRNLQPESFGENTNQPTLRPGPVARVRSSDERSKGNAASTGSDSSNSRRRHGRESRHKLSSALRMANNAVLLDNNEEYEPAIEAYEEACRLLSEAIAQSETEEDRKRLMDIRSSYAGRVDELRQVHHDGDGSKRESQFDLRPSLDLSLDGDDPYPIVETAVATRIVEQDHGIGSKQNSATQGAPVQMPRPLAPKRSTENQQELDTHRQTSNVESNTNGRSRWPPRSEFESAYSVDKTHPPESTDYQPGHQRKLTSDTETEFDAALDAAVEAAYMEGYEPYRQELFDHAAKRISHRFSLIRTTDALSATEERMIAEREAKIQAARAQVLEQRSQLPRQGEPAMTLTEEEEEERILNDFRATQQAGSNNHHSRQESMTDTTGSAGDGRHSESSVFSGQTYHSSVTSSLTNGGPLLSTVDEDSHLAHMRKKSLPPPPPPPETPTLGRFSDQHDFTHARKNSTPQPALNVPQSPTVRERRLSAKAAKALKITTPMHPDDYLSLNQPMQYRTASSESLEPPKTAPSASSATHLTPDVGKKAWNISSPFPSPLPAQTFNQVVTTPDGNGQSLERVATAPEDGARYPSDPPARSLQPGVVPPPLKHSASSLSLRNHQNLTPALTLSPSGEMDPSPSTPISFAFNTLSTPVGRGPMAPMNTPANFSFQGNLPPAPAQVTEARIFDNDLHSPELPGHPNPEVKDAPKQLEPCPESTLLRPYWLMRCFYQTLAHPRGGYLSQKLFIPRDVWKAKNVKLRAVEDKVASCDLLTAALLKLAGANTYDADAILEGMQSLEHILDQQQATLSKKLGTEVGHQSISSLFKDAPTLTSPGAHSNSDSHAGDHNSTGTRSSSKGYFSSFRKLRGKGSTANLAGSANQARDSASGITMSSVPMTAQSAISTRIARHVTYPDAKYIGPNGAYMEAIARLCDAAQVLDQIARQVEDPGLRHSSPAHVGMELSSRHAAEFFGFFVCRFVLQDIILLSEKYIKKASEWVMT